MRVFGERVGAHGFTWKVKDAHLGPLPCSDGDPFCWNRWYVKTFRFTGGGTRTRFVPWVGAQPEVWKLIQNEGVNVNVRSMEMGATRAHRLQVCLGT